MIAPSMIWPNTQLTIASGCQSSSSVAKAVGLDLPGEDGAARNERRFDDRRLDGDDLLADR